MKPIILFDIDRTLFNTDHLQDQTSKKLIETLGINRRKFEKARDAYLASLPHRHDFHPEGLVKHLSTFYKQSYDQLFSSYHHIDNYSLFPETLSVIKKLSPKYILGIYSEGYKDFQTQKLAQTDLLSIFDQNYIFIHRRKLLPEIISDLPRSLVIDDNPEVINTLSQFPHLTPIWINRKDRSAHSTATTIFTLGQLFPHLSGPKAASGV